MRGYRVPRKAGWDTHGLPVELEVERRLGIDGKQQIEDYGVAEFNQLCRESVTAYLEEWERFTERIGFWVDLGDAYYTFDNEYIETVWWLLRQIWDKGLLYQGHKVVPYCPRCGTAISSHEVAQGYKDVTEDSIYVRFPLRRGGRGHAGRAGGRARLPGRVDHHALDAHQQRRRGRAPGRHLRPRREPRRALRAGPRAWSRRCSAARPSSSASSRAASCSGSSYEPPFRFMTPEKPAHFVVGGDFVTTGDGTGHRAHGPRLRRGRHARRPRERPAGRQRRRHSRAGSSPRSRRGPGVFVKDADPAIIAELKARGLLLGVEPYEHSYPFCWRCDTALLYYAKATWYISTTAIKDQLIKANDDVVWHPEHIKTRALRRVAGQQRRLGAQPRPLLGHAAARLALRRRAHALRGVHRRAARDGGRAGPGRPRAAPALRRRRRARLPRVRRRDAPRRRGHRRLVRLGLHALRASGTTRSRTRSMFRERFPADFICEAIDQTRGWFYSLLAIATLVEGRSSYKRVLCLGHILDADGQKMSKSKGNVVQPDDDPRPAGRRRLPLVHVRQPEPVEPAALQRRDGRRGGAQVPAHAVEHVQLLHGVRQHRRLRPGGRRRCRWRSGRCSTAGSSASSTTLVQTVTEGLEQYDATGTCRAIQEFVDDLSNWYVRRSRRRFWKSESDRDKLAAYHTLYEALVTVTKLLAPFTPFVAEELYQNLVRERRRRGARRACTSAPGRWPTSRPSTPACRSTWRRRGASSSWAARRATPPRVKTRQPLAEVVVALPEAERRAVEGLRDVVLDELNVKAPALRRRRERDGGLHGEAQPQGARAAARASSSARCRRRSRTPTPPPWSPSSGPPVAVADRRRRGELRLADEELLIETGSPRGLPGGERRRPHGRAVTTVDEALREEGVARELVHAVQLARKNADLRIEDTISLTLSVPDELRRARRSGTRRRIKAETLASELSSARPRRPPRDGARRGPRHRHRA